MHNNWLKYLSLIIEKTHHLHCHVIENECDWLKDFIFSSSYWLKNIFKKNTEIIIRLANFTLAYKENISNGRVQHESAM